MPRDHGRILATIWQDKDFRQRTPGAQRLYMLLLSQPNVNNAGVLPLQVSKWAKGCVHTAIEDVQKALDELAEYRYVVYDDDTEEALIRSYMRNDGVMKHPNLVKNALRCVEATESLELRAVLADELRRTRRADAIATAQKVWPADAESIPSESHSEPIKMPSETHSNAECHPDAISILAGKGKGKGKGKTLVGTQVGEPPPNEFCTKHPDGTTDSCRGCRVAREHREAWDAAQANDARDTAAAFWAEVEAAECCDPKGRIDSPYQGNALTKCPNHDWSVLNA